jgi:hypothetical protein
MPNIFVQRYFILGSPQLLNQVFNKYFYQQGNQWKSRGLMEEDPLDSQILNSGDFIHEKDKIVFSSYMGWDMHPELIEQMAKKLPRGTVLLVIGFDMDDYPTEEGGQILEIEGGTGHLIKNETHSSQIVAKYYFPQLYEDISK